MAKKQATNPAGKRVVKKAAQKPVKSASRSRPAAATANSSRTALRKKPAEKASDSQRSRSQPLDQRLAGLDKQILKLLNDRTDLTVQQLQSRAAQDPGPFDAPLEQELWGQLDEANTGSLSSTAVRSIYREILSAARNRVKTVRVAYLGPRFSFTHLASIQRFGKSADLIPVNTIAAVFEEVNRGHCDFGIVPIENSTDGRIVDTLDMFTRLPIRICGEVQMSVHHNLMSRSPRSEINEIYSKPQALSQCRDWLARNMPLAHLHEVTSTSTAATLARDKPGAGAIASAQAAVEYGLNILAERIEDNSHNVTRFAVIGDQETKPTGQDRTALLLQISHQPGSLSDALTSFKKSKINLTWIESFPLRGPEVGYLFFLDFEGHIQDPRIRRAIAELESKAVRLEVLGSYPRSEPVD